MAGELSGESAGRFAGRAAAGSSAFDYRRSSRTGGHQDAGIDAGKQHALEQPVDGQKDRALADGDRAHLAFGLQPHRVENFKFSKDPQFVEKVRDIVGLYMNPPDRAIMLCVDEKSQVQALNRTQPILPLGPGVPARQSHDYQRHGVTSLFAAMDVASGVTISHCYRRHRHQEFLRFLDEIEANLPGGFQVHLVMDNYGTHKVAKVRGWLARHPPYHVHFIPTNGSWLNLVERLFGELTERCVRRGSHTAVAALEKAMLDYLDKRNRGDGLDSRPLPKSETQALYVDRGRRSDPGQGRATL
jgi:hypothetical protein